jgi:hypothetical protein
VPAVARMTDEMTTMAESKGALKRIVLDDHQHQAFWLAMSNWAELLKRRIRGL